MTERASLSDLSDDGDFVELDDGRTVRLKIEPDDMPFLFRDRHGNLCCNDEMWGEFAFVDTRSDYRHNSRPAGFTGNAEIIQSRGGDPLWWEPPSGDYQPYDPDTP